MKNTAIEWAHHTLSPGVHSLVAALAKGHAVRQIKPQLGVSGEGFDVVRMQVAPTIVPAMLACKTIAQHHVVAPSLVGLSQPLAVAFRTAAIHAPRGILAARGALSGRCADFRARVHVMRLAEAVARPSLRSRAHLGATLVGHRSSLHRWDKRRLPFQPCLAHDFAAREGFSHG